MEKGLNFRTLEGQQDYTNSYKNALELFSIPMREKYIETSFGHSHVLCFGKENNPPLVLLHAASCGSVIWFKNIHVWSENFCVYAIDLISESSMSILTRKMNPPKDNSKWLDETLSGLGLQEVALCGLSIGGWNAANYASTYPDKVNKLILISPVQMFAKMYNIFFAKIMKMGFLPTRENIENYIGWGNEKEEPLPDCIIKLFTVSIQNMNSNVCFPKWLKRKQLQNINMPVLLMLGSNEFAFSVTKAEINAKKIIRNLTLEIVDDASHLIPVSKPEYTNHQVLHFLQSN